MQTAFDRQYTSELEDRVDDYVFHLGLVARGERIAWHLSNTCEALARRARGVERIEHKDRDRLLAALRGAFATAAAPLASMIGAGLADIGERTMRTLVVRWAQDDADRALRSPGEMADLAAQARIFQNAVHNVCLVEDIATRAKLRADALSRAVS